MSLKLLAQSAMLGVDAAPAAAVALHPELDALCLQLERDMPPARALLRRAAVLTLTEDAGRPSTRPSPAPIAPYPAEARPEIQHAAALALVQVLDGVHADLLATLLAEVANRGRRLPPWLLPRMLDHGTGAAQRDVVRPILCQVAAWLGAMNPAWAYAAGADDSEEVFATGASAARREAFRRLRGQDPRRAAERLVATFAQDAPDDREAFVQALAVGLGPDDEPFLEATLDDRRKGVRTAAAGLLTRLPQSRLVARMIERATPCLNFKRGLLRSTLDIHLPETCDKSMLRDGVEAKPTSSGTGERSWWLAQILACVPLQHWRQRFGLDAYKLLALTLKHEHGATLRRAFAQAIWRFDDTDGARAWYTLTERERDFHDDFDVHVLPVLARLPDFETIVLRQFQIDDGPLPASFLNRLDTPWSERMSRRVLESLRDRRRIERLGRQYEYLLRIEFLLVARRIAPIPEMLSGWTLAPEDGSAWQKAIDEFLAIAEFRIKFTQYLEAP